MVTFREFAEAISPPWLRGYWGERFMGGLALLYDYWAEGTSEALKAPWMRQTSSPSDALIPAGEDASIEAAPAETNAHYRARLVDKWNLWERAATVVFADNALEPFGIAQASTLLKANYEWVADPASTHWSRWWVVLLPDSISGATLPFTAETWGPEVWGDAGTWGSSATQSDIFAIIRFLCKWKSAHEIGVRVILDYGNALWGLGTWGTGTWNGDAVFWELGRFWGTKYKSTTWGGDDPYDSGTTALWGAKLKV